MGEEISSLTKQLQEKLTAVSLISEESKAALSRNSRREIERHLHELEGEIEEFCKLKVKIRSEKLKVEDAVRGKR